LYTTNFQCSGILESASRPFQPVSLTLPNGKEYLFSYESTTGRIQSVTLPTGAVYQYSYPRPNDGVICPSGNIPSVPLARMTRTITNGSTVLTKTYSLTGALACTGCQTTITASASPSAPGTNFTTVITSAAMQRELTRKIYSGSTASGTPLRLGYRRKPPSPTYESDTVHSATELHRRGPLFLVLQQSQHYRRPPILGNLCRRLLPTSGFLTFFFALVFSRPSH